MQESSSKHTPGWTESFGKIIGLLKNLADLINAVFGSNAIFNVVAAVYTVGTVIAATFLEKYRENLLLMFVGFTAPLIAAWAVYRRIDTRLETLACDDGVYHGFRRLSRTISYEIKSDTASSLHYVDVAQATETGLIVYPMYHWTAENESACSMPAAKSVEIDPETEEERTSTRKDQHVLGVIKDGKVEPYREQNERDKSWRCYFVALNPPVKKGDRLKIIYNQNFRCRKGKKFDKHLGFYAERKLETLTLRAKPLGAPSSITISDFGPLDRIRPTTKCDAWECYDQTTGWITWSVCNPENGHEYRINWS